MGNTNSSAKKVEPEKKEEPAKKSIWQGIGGWFKDKATKAKNWFKDKATKAKNWFKDKATKAKNWFIDKGKKIKNWFLGTKVGKWCVKTAEKIKNWFIKTAAAIRTWIKDKCQKLLNWIAKHPVLAGLLAACTALLGGVVGILATMTVAAPLAVSGIVAAIVGVIPTAINSAKNQGKAEQKEMHAKEIAEKETVNRALRKECADLKLKIERLTKTITKLKNIEHDLEKELGKHDKDSIKIKELMLKHQIKSEKCVQLEKEIKELKKQIETQQKKSDVPTDKSDAADNPKDKSDTADESKKTESKETAPKEEKKDKPAQAEGKVSIIKISGDGLHCGILSLTYGMKLQMELNPGKKHKIPQELLSLIDYSKVSPSSQDAAAHGRNLREVYLRRMLNSDEEYKKVRSDIFLRCCMFNLDYDVEDEKEGRKVYGNDMQSFEKSNQELMNRLKEDKIKIVKAMKYIKAEVLDQKRVEELKERFDKKMVEYLKKFNNKELSSLSDKEQDDLFHVSVEEDFWITTEYIFVSEFCQLFKLFWDKVGKNDATEKARKIFKNEIYTIILREIYRTIQSQISSLSNPTSEFSDAYYQLLLKRYSDALKLIGYFSNDDEYNIVLLHTMYILFNNEQKIWKECDKRYIDYACTQPVMLTAGELSRLAHYFEVSLVQLGQNGMRNVTGFPNPLGDHLTVTIYNPTGVHYDVLLEEKPKVKVEQSKETADKPKTESKQVKNPVIIKRREGEAKPNPSAFFQPGEKKEDISTLKQQPKK